MAAIVSHHRMDTRISRLPSTAVPILVITFTYRLKIFTMKTNAQKLIGIRAQGKIRRNGLDVPESTLEKLKEMLHSLS